MGRLGSAAGLFFTLALAAALAGSLHAQYAGGVTGITNAISALCQGATSLLPVAAMLMIIIAAVVYASGQLMGAETRARANVWATAALTGAFIAMLIATVAPGVLGMIYGGTVSCTASSGGGGVCNGIGGSCTPCCTYGLTCSGGVCSL